MTEPESPVVLRFEAFELDLRTRELRRDGRLVKMQDLPARLLALLASRAGELVSREEIEKQLWGEDQFVDFEHGVNTAMRKIREALAESPEQPRFVETLPRKGYRFIAAVETVGASGEWRKARAVVNPAAPAVASSAAPLHREGAAAPNSVPAIQHDDFLLPPGTARNLFQLIQAGYVAIYCATLYKWESLQEVLNVVYRVPTSAAVPLVLVLAACGIAVRLYLLTSVGLKHPDAETKYLKIFPLLFVVDIFWAASPLLLVRKLGIGLALAGVATLAYLPFVQRILIRSSHGETL